ncbi:unnamed protein product [Caenorhabditis bovis]|uniref:Uncharacterized protein n=1 Tax=Caenorhabditis bovis TaxID=2654633 RepID=A0A8S1ERJ4_9PELO|nr:unnamed protein product [Caenorhabditis bovis]
MDDILSAAICEAGLEEFLISSPVPSTSGSLHDDSTTSAQGSSVVLYDDTSNEGMYAPLSEYMIPCTSASTTFTTDSNDGVPSMNMEFAPVSEPEIPSIQLIPRKIPPSAPPATVVTPKPDPEPEPEKGTAQASPAKDEIEQPTKEPQPLRVQISKSVDNNDHSASPSPSASRFVASTPLQRSSTASPASTVSTTSNSMQGAPVTIHKKTAITAVGGPIIKRTIHTRNGVQTQYLKPYINEQGQKIYRALSSVPAVGASRGSISIRGGRPTAPTASGAANAERPGERVVMVRQEGPNGQHVLVKKVITTAPNPNNDVLPMARRGSLVSRVAGRGGIVMRGGSAAQRGPYTTASGYRVTNIIGRGTGGSTMLHHQPMVQSRMVRPPASRVTPFREQGQVRYTHRDDVQNRGLHPSNSSPAFHYLDQEPNVGYQGKPQQSVKSQGIIAQRNGNLKATALQRTLINRVQTNAGIQRLASGAGGAFEYNMNSQRLMMTSSLPRSPGSGLSPRVVPSFNSTAATPILQSKSQKAKDEMKMAYQMGRDELIEQRRNEIDDDEENLGYAETYAEYRPAKLRSGIAHPDSVVESASLSSVAPPDVKYQISIPEYLIDLGHISALQLEAVIYACQMHERRMPSGERYGYLIGDGAGVGKGRTVACIIFENYLQGRKRAIWLSVSSDLKFDAERDLRDVGAPNIGVYALNKMKYAKISGKENGCIKKGVIFATYTSLIGECRGAKSRKYRSRIKQLIQWFGVEYDGVIILDECHRAKNLVPSTGGKPTKTGRMVLELQKALPNARVVYASATGATEPRNMAYMTRLGLWGERQAFPEFTDFISAVERRGVGAMEVVAMDMKQRGLYLARQLSFRGVSFSVQEVQLSADFVKMYDESVKLWMEARRQFQVVLEAMDEDERATCKTVWGQFWACHQRFFKYLCIAAKVDTCVQIAREAIKAKKCVVIGLQSTGESATLETLEEMGGELNEFVSTAKTVLYGLIDKHFPTDSSSDRDIFKDFDRMYDEFERPAKRKKQSNTLSFMTDVGVGSWSGATVGMSGKVGQSSTTHGSEANSTTSESSSDDDSDSDDDKDDDDAKSWDSAREEAEGARTLDDMEEDEWVKALLAEAESSSDSEDDEDEEQEEPKQEESANGQEEEEFNPFMCDFANDDPWANNQQIIDDQPVKRKAKKRKRVDDAETEEMKERRRRREERREKKLKRAMRKAEREKKRRMETLQTRGSANDFISSSKFCGNDDEDRTNINPLLIKTELLAAVERLAPSLPANTLDQLIDELGGPEYVAEMTGRRGHMVTTETGDVAYQRRNANAEVSLELINMEEKEKFMRGEKLIAIISEAASSGISLQSDRRAQNTRRRVHITLELPWSADKAIQQFGRTHRSNQVSGPEYIFLISELAGEKRFASVVAKRLESLGALTHGDRRATETRDLSQFNMDNKYGRVALDLLLKTVIGQTNPPLIPPPSDYTAGNFFEDMRLYMEGVGLLARNKNGVYGIEKEAATIPKFLNRILGLPVHAQNALFQYFSEIVAELIAQSKHDGTYDTGIMDLGTGDDQVRKLETRIFLGRVDNGSFRVEIHKIGVERGVSWEEAMQLYKDHNSDEDGFYVCTPGPNSSGRKVAALVYGIGKVRIDNGARLYAITRPSTGRSPKLLTMADLSKRFTKSTPEEVKDIWISQYEGAETMCQHNYVYGKCKTEIGGTYCEVGRRTRTYFVLSGSVLSVWPIVEEVLSGGDRKSSRMQVIRVRTEQDQKIVGLLVLPAHVRCLVQQLETHCGRSILKTDEPPK